MVRPFWSSARVRESLDTSFLRPRRVVVPLFLVVLATFALVLVVLTPISDFASWAKFAKASGLFQYHQTSASQTSPATSSLHLLIPVTSSNQHVCRLLLSTTALGYPTPVFINWGHAEDDNKYKQHLGKVVGIRDYLSTLSKKHDNDLVLIVDGFDIWFQLRPEVLIKRYYNVITAANARLSKRIDTERTDVLDIRNSVLFGPDKICWPSDPTRPACWAVPNSTLPQYAFGPHTDTNTRGFFLRPRWLNSGTIMGPVVDVRRLFRATAKRIHSQKAKVLSDQYFFANLWGEQEYARKLLAGEPLPSASEMNQARRAAPIHIPHRKSKKLQIPKIDPSSGEAEHHIALDYESQLFQTVSYYFPYLAWVKYDRSTYRGQMSSPRPMSSSLHFDLGEDIDASPGPFFPGKTGQAGHVQDDGLPTNISWGNVLLGTNIVSRYVFPIFHITAPKKLRHHWWTRMWYYPYGSAIINAAGRIPKGPYGRSPDGRVWSNYEPAEHGASGAFAENGTWLSWDVLCGEHEAAVFRNERESNRGVVPDHGDALEKSVEGYDDALRNERHDLNKGYQNRKTK